MPKQYVLGLLVFLFVAASAFVIWFSMSETNQTQEIRGQAYGTDNGGGGSNGGGNNGGGNNGGGTATCSEDPVNVQFRVWTGQDTPWIDGKDIKLKTGEFVEVNCFAKNGSALLQNPRMSATLTVNNTTEAVTLPNPNAPEVRKFAVTKAGVYTFTCKNAANTCSNTDKFTVTAAASTSCKRTGCSNHLCVDANAADITTTCQFLPEHACYQAAECKVQTNGQCGFTQTSTLTACLNNNNRVSPTPAVSPSATPVATPTGTFAVSDLNRDGKTDLDDYVIFFNAYQQNSGL